jgi:nicotinamide mononucleotide transporter
MLGSTRTLLDATSTVVSVVAMYLMVKRYATQWELWIIVDIVSTAMWIGKDWIMVAMWAAYLINAIWGFYQWNYKLESE